MLYDHAQTNVESLLFSLSVLVYRPVQEQNYLERRLTQELVFE
jgi:hypothetical protein